MRGGTYFSVKKKKKIRLSWKYTGLGGKKIKGTKDLEAISGKKGLPVPQAKG